MYFVELPLYFKPKIFSSIWQRQNYTFFIQLSRKITFEEYKNNIYLPVIVILCHGRSIKHRSHAKIVLSYYFAGIFGKTFEYVLNLKITYLIF